MAEFMLPGIQEVEKYAMYREQGHRPPGAAPQPEQCAGDGDGSQVRQGLNGACTIGRDAQTAQLGGVDHVTPHEDFVHRILPSGKTHPTTALSG